MLIQIFSQKKRLFSQVLKYSSFFIRNLCISMRTSFYYFPSTLTSIECFQSNHIIYMVNNLLKFILLGPIDQSRKRRKSRSWAFLDGELIPRCIANPQTTAYTFTGMHMDRANGKLERCPVLYDELTKSARRKKVEDQN